MPRHRRVTLSPSLQRIYACFWLATMILRLPWWIVTNLTPAQRPRKSWSLMKAVFLRCIDAWVVGEQRCNMNLPFLTPPADVPGRVYVDGAPDLIAGKVKEWAEKAGVGAERIPGYWIHKTDVSIVSGEKPNVDKDEKVVYYLHGGGYSMGSAHPKDTYSAIPLAFLESCPSVKRAFNIEYRLCSVPPEPARAPFPCALIDAISGYGYLINKFGLKPEQIILVGDSAGANLAQALTRYLVEYKGTVPGLPDVPGLLVLLSPWADMSGSHWSQGTDTGASPPSLYSNSHDLISSFFTPNKIDAPLPFIEPFGSDIALKNPYISPASKYLEDVSFEGFPRTLINAGDAEVLLDQCRELYKRMKASLGEDMVVYYEEKDAWHDYLLFFTEPERSQTLKVIAEFIEGK